MNESITLHPPNQVIFDWHGTLVDTQDAMVAALEEMLPLLEELSLVDRLRSEDLCKSKDDVKLVRYIRLFRRLHPKILAERRVSRTEIFNAIFGDDTDAKNLAHRAYNRCYRNYFGKVKPFQDGVREYLASLQRLGITVGVATNRSREFFQHELRTVDDGSWPRLIDLSTCADDVTHYKPDPQVIRYTLAKIDTYPRLDTWYIGDSYLDIVTAREAGVVAIFYNGGCRTQEELRQLFADSEEYKPDAIINSFDELMDLLQQVQSRHPDCFKKVVSKARPPKHNGPLPPPPHIEPDWHPSVAKLSPPTIILFDWHATLVDTLDAMYRAVDDMLPELEEHGLLHRIVDPRSSKSPDDARLVTYVKEYAQLHPKIKADRKISRTDIFEVLFGDDLQAKKTAHKIFNQHYRNHFGTVLPFEPKVRNVLMGLKALGLQLGVITNRDREFFEHEIKAVEEGTWADLFDTMVCGDDTVNRKPQPDQLIEASAQLGRDPAMDIWYVGDSTTDIIASKLGGFTGVFFNGAQWDQSWLQTIFPGNHQYPHKPDVVVNDFSEFWALVLACYSVSTVK